MKPGEDKLFTHIKERLTAHEEDYLPGAWERFEKKERKKPVLIWLVGLSSAAAVLLIGFTLWYIGDKMPDKANLAQVKSSTPSPEVQVPDRPLPDVPKPPMAIENLKIEVSANKQVVEQRKRNKVSENPFIVAAKQPADIIPPADPVVQPGAAAQQTTGSIAGPDKLRDAVAKVGAKAQDSVQGSKVRSFQEFLDAEVKSNNALAAAKPTAKKADKWEMGLMVAPAIGNAKKLNMGYGVSMGYALSDKVSISSGISYNEMNASRTTTPGNSAPNLPTAMGGVVSDTKRLESVDANLVGIDIPLGIKYYLSKKVYTNIGVSAFAVLNQKQNNNYVQGSVEYAADQVNPSGFNAVFQERIVSEPVPSAVKGDKYLGFYNFSFGFKQQISGGKAFSVEPFTKLPMKPFAKESLYLIGTGVRLKFDF